MWYFSASHYFWYVTRHRKCLLNLWSTWHKYISLTETTSIHFFLVYLIQLYLINIASQLKRPLIISPSNVKFFGEMLPPSNSSKWACLQASRFTNPNLTQVINWKYQSWFCLFCFFFHSEYIKVIDGNGITVLSRYGDSSVTRNTFREVSFGNFSNISVQIYLRYSSSTFKLQFGILKRGPGWPFIC